MTERERKHLFSSLCTAAMHKGEFYPGACSTCQSRCEYGKQALELMNIAAHETEKESVFENVVPSHDRKMRRLLRSFNKKRWF